LVEIAHPNAIDVIGAYESMEIISKPSPVAAKQRI